MTVIDTRGKIRVGIPNAESGCLCGTIDIEDVRLLRAECAVKKKEYGQIFTEK